MPFLETFYRKNKKKSLIFLIVFYIFYESGIKMFLKWFTNRTLLNNIKNKRNIFKGFVNGVWLTSTSSTFLTEIFFCFN